MEPVTILLGLAALTGGLIVTTKKGSAPLPESTDRLSVADQVRVGDHVMVGPQLIFPIGLPFDVNAGLRSLGLVTPMQPNEQIREVELLVTDTQETNREIQGVTTGFVLDGPGRTVFVTIPERIPTKFFSRGAVLSASRKGEPLVDQKVAKASVGAGLGEGRWGRPETWRRPKNLFRRYADVVVLPWLRLWMPRCRTTACGLWQPPFNQTQYGNVPAQMTLVAYLSQGAAVRVISGPKAGTVNGKTGLWLWVQTPQGVYGWIDAAEVAYS